MTKNSLLKHWFRTSILLGLQLSLLLLAGCSGGNKSSTVSGKVTYKGEPVPGGNITLVPAEGPGGPIQIPIKADGTFSASDVPPGMKKVGIETESMKPGPGKGGPGYQMPANTPKPPDAKEKKQFEVDTSNQTKYMKIPPKYADPNKSGLTWDIGKGKQEKPFELTD